MPLPSLFRIDLRRLIVLLAIVGGLVTLSISFYASYQVQRGSLMDNTLEANRAYAVKLAAGTEIFFASVQQQLQYSANILAEQFGDPDKLAEEADRLRLQTDSFNSAVITDAHGIVRATSPRVANLIGQPLDSPGAREALRERRPLVSSPYMSAIGKLIVSISQPIFDKEGTYLGYIAGIINLKEPNILGSMLGEHFYHDGSYLYAVDQSRRLLYHPDPKRLGEVVKKNAVIDQVLRGESGSQRVINSRGLDMLAGFAPVPTAGWGIVAQRPTAATLHPLDNLMLEVLRQTAPLALLTFFGVWLLSGLISRPLWQLARSASEMDAPDSQERIQQIRSWYFESSQLKRAMQVGVNLMHQRIGKLNLDVQTDPLTGLLNRRGLTLALERLSVESREFAVVALDIDHFKRVNDSFGHDVGDQVIRHIAGLMTTCSRGADTLCRSGGEEFLMLLPDANLEAAWRVAERLRLYVEQDTISEVGHVTISLGIAAWPGHPESIEQVLKQADAALYRAKQRGRNRSEVAQFDPSEPGNAKHSD
ncbi:diguanylate cyclase [Stutzerimonas stutzeri]|uniref:diguanylate cyclase n=1 Tax=Stutzerimonas stutzeri TaxID=316 RepID=W8QZP4_STUST|nr:sensor domain-containing diguanylate cyclase [Stutzerimonas stutzeri]AHL76065.1 diguanylate cyclase [Stutzerimonas stutzeri]MCQ4330583.1 sensor domain-containing diguanylate cyclase [Stutzerimonas stutzeri]